METRIDDNNYSNTQGDIIPFLKWAGGKRWLVSQHSYLFPKNFNRYIEPFLGSAAVFFHLKPANGILADSNPDLILTYKAIRNDWKRVQTALSRHHCFHSCDYYYEERQRRRRVAHEKAAQFIYLNRTCWNGLYRVNLKGKFNVPIGTKSQVVLPTDDFEAIASCLAPMSLRNADFETTISHAKKGDLVFIDPPYTVNHNMNGFLKYNEKIFSWRDQLRLKRSIDKANSRGAFILMTNAAHDSVISIYQKEYNISELNRWSILSGNPKFRGETKELIVRNFF